MVNIDKVNTLSADFGLVVRGGFFVTAEDRVEDIETDVAARSIILFGNAGSSLWGSFSQSDEYADDEPDPLNKWSERVGNFMAEKLGGRALFPFGGPPYQPFLRWAMKSESLQNSRLGMLIHPKYGLWHAYRFAIIFPESVTPLQVSPNSTDICERCVDQPCLKACPVDAFTGSVYQVDRCFEYLETNPETSCRSYSCKARLACPEGVGFRYQSDHAKFHMTAFFNSIKVRIEQSEKD